MHLIDWLFLIVPLLLVLCIGAYARHYMKSVVDFMSGGRLADRYLLAVASGELQAGAVVFVASFERVAKSGFTLIWWSWIQVPIILVVGIFGFVGFRFRETRSLTLAQFFEIRYSKRFRLFTGLLAFLAGIANFGIIPAVGARCFVYFLGLPESLQIANWALPTYIPLMALFLTITLIITLAGGFITVMITDCAEGILSQLIYLVLIATLLYMFPWSDISATLAAVPSGQSRLNPFDSQGMKDFNVWYILMGLATSIYGRLAWQNASGYSAASINPHEGRMGGILGNWREMGKNATITLLAVCAVTYLSHPAFAAQSAAAHERISAISNPQIQQQMAVPVALSNLLPVGVKGLLCAILLMGVFGGDSTHLHSWGSIFVQDVILPRRQVPFTPEQHIRTLRYGIIGVAIFAFLFGCFFRQTEYIFMWWAVTMAIFVGGAGSAIIGGLYWKKGTTPAAWAALITGSSLSVAGIITRNVTAGGFPLNGVQISFGSMLISIAVYVSVSLLTCREDFNLDRMLHRGKYAVLKPLVGDQPLVATEAGRKTSWGKYIGFDEAFTRGDKWIAGGLFIWSMAHVVVLVVGTVWNWISPWPLSWWSSFWHINSIIIPVTIAAITGVWFTWGGIRDMRALFRRLREEKVNPLDDGFVVGHQNLDEEVLAKKGVIAAEPPKNSNV